MSRMCFNCMKMTEDGEFCAFCGKKLKTAPAHHLLPGTILNGKYTVGYALGEGGFGVTYIGLDNSLQIKVAIKEFFPKGIVGRNSAITSDVSCLNAGESDKLFDTEKAKVINEARILAKFSKERGIVNVREYFEANNTAYIVMEYLEGETLEEYLAHSGPISADEAYTLLHPVMKVLGQLHAEGVVHRDISPDNLMFDGEQIKLLDFGAAREVLYSTSKSFSVILKHGYAPEEQYRRKGHQGAWTDVYSLCATMYYCITNVIPDTSLDRMHEDELKRPSDLGVSISEQHEDALMRGLSVLPEDRLQSVADFIAVWNGEFVAMPNPQKETIATYSKDNVPAEDKNGKANTSGPETIYSGEADYASVDSDERRVPGYYPPVDESVTNESKSKAKKKRLIFAIVGGIVAFLLVGLIVLLLLLVGINNDNHPNGPGTNTSESQIQNTEAEDKYQRYIEEADGYLEQKKFDEALATLDTAEQILGAHNKIKEKRKNVIKEKGLYQLAQYESNSDYKNALIYINDNLSDYSSDKDISNKKNLYTTKYREKVLIDAENALQSNGYKEAVRILQEALDVLKNDSQISSKIEEYKSYEPIRLEELKVTASNDGYDFCSSKSDPRGETNTDVLHLESYVEFYAGKQYSKFTATIDPVEYFKTSEYAGTQLKILADDVVVYQSPTITYKTDDLNVSVDIKHAEYLRLELVYVGGTKFSDYWNADDILICNPCVAK